MNLTSYDYTKEINVGRLELEIRNSEITIALHGINFTVPDVVVVVFKEVLPTADKTLLDSIVADHVAIPLDTENKFLDKFKNPSNDRRIMSPDFTVDVEWNLSPVAGQAFGMIQVKASTAKDIVYTDHDFVAEVWAGCYIDGNGDFQKTGQAFLFNQSVYVDFLDMFAEADEQQETDNYYILYWKWAREDSYPFLLKSSDGVIYRMYVKASDAVRDPDGSYPVSVTPFVRGASDIGIKLTARFMEVNESSIV